jgi:hypothetical protein
MLHVLSAPVVFVNGKPMTGERTLKHLESVIALSRARVTLDRPNLRSLFESDATIVRSK